MSESHPEGGSYPSIDIGEVSTAAYFSAEGAGNYNHVIEMRVRLYDRTACAVLLATLTV